MTKATLSCNSGKISTRRKEEKKRNCNRVWDLARVATPFFLSMIHNFLKIHKCNKDSGLWGQEKNKWLLKKVRTYHVLPVSIICGAILKHSLHMYSHWFDLHCTVLKIFEANQYICRCPAIIAQFFSVIHMYNKK